MMFWRTWPGTVILVLLAGAGVGTGAVGVQVHRVTHPPRQIPDTERVGFELAGLEDVRFAAADGTELSGWLLNGRPDHPAVVLCHDLGESKDSLLNLMIPLGEEGFTLLAFDFRGHGDSEGEGSTLGLAEHRDVIGAVDFLEARIGSRAEIAVYGAGLGAHAAAIAAEDRPSVRVLVLDGLYPDPSYALVRRVYPDWSFGVRYLGFLPSVVFRALNAGRTDQRRAADVLPRLIGRDILLVAPESDRSLTREIERMYHTIPEQADADGNLVRMPGTRVAALVGDDLARYSDRVRSFLVSRLRVPDAPGVLTSSR